MHLRLLYKKFLCVFMSLMIVFISTQSAYATTSVGGWTALDTITAGANNTINATKTAGGKVLKSAVAVAPSAAKVGKHLIKGGGAAALAFAMVELLDAGVDWVLDPANNGVTYTPASGSGDVPSSSLQYVYINTGGVGGYSATAKAASKFEVDALVAQNASREYLYESDNCPAVPTSLINCIVVYDAVHARPNKYNVTVGTMVNPNYDPDAGATTPNGKKTIPIETVAAKVIANAQAGHAPSQEAVKATALEGFAAGEHDAALDAAATPDAGTENPPVDTPTDPTKPFDPSSILSALAGISAILAGIMSALTGFVDWWKAQWTTFSTGITGFFEWVRAEPDTASLQPEPVEVTEGTLVDGWQDKANAGYVNMGNTQCPSDVLIPISYMGASTNLSISYVPFCHFASIIRYAVIMGAWIAALMIISGGRTKE